VERLRYDDVDEVLVHVAEVQSVVLSAGGDVADAGRAEPDDRDGPEELEVGAVDVQLVPVAGHEHVQLKAQSRHSLHNPGHRLRVRHART